MRVHESNLAVHIRALDRTADQHVRQLGEIRDADNSIQNAPMRLLHRIYRGTISQHHIRRGDAPKLAALGYQGIVRVRASKGHELINLTPEAAYAFDVPP